jgi:glycine hydroxymethyltransferase
MLTMDLSHGGHLTHGNKANFSGKFLRGRPLRRAPEDERIDYDALATWPRAPAAMITVGASAYPRIIDFERMGRSPAEVGAYLLADIAHIAGLVAAGCIPARWARGLRHHHHAQDPARAARRADPVPGGTRQGRSILQMFPGIQGGPLMHVIAAKAVCFHEALQPAFKRVPAAVVRNAQALAEGMQRNGFRLVSGGTDNHLMLVDVGARGHRQGLPDRPRPGRASPSTRTPSRSRPARRSRPAASASAPPPSPPAA